MVIRWCRLAGLVDPIFGLFKIANKTLARKVSLWRGAKKVIMRLKSMYLFIANSVLTQYWFRDENGTCIIHNQERRLSYQCIAIFAACGSMRHVHVAVGRVQCQWSLIYFSDRSRRVTASLWHSVSILSVWIVDQVPTHFGERPVGDYLLLSKEQKWYSFRMTLCCDIKLGGNITDAS
jgi:hypothetical protein